MKERLYRTNALGSKKDVAVGILPLANQDDGLYVAQIGERELAKSMLGQARRWGIEIIEQDNLVTEIASNDGLSELSQDSLEELGRLVFRSRR